MSSFGRWGHSLLQGALTAPLRRDMHRLAREVGAPVLLLATGLEAFDAVSRRPNSAIGARQEILVRDALRAILPRHRTLHLCVIGYGGRSTSATTIFRALRSRFDHVNVYLPHVTSSAAALVALAGDAIFMSDSAYLTSLDPQLVINGAYVPTSALVHGTLSGEEARPEWRLAARVQLESAEAIVATLLRGARYPDEVVGRVVDRLVTRPGAHDAPLFRREVRALGLRVADDDACDGNAVLQHFERALASLIRLGVGHSLIVAQPAP